MVPSPSVQALPVDPEQAGLFTDPEYFERMARLRAEAPVQRYAPHSWTVARYDDVRTVSRDPARFRSGQGVLMNDPMRAGHAIPGSILHMDPPEHAAWRRLGSRWFTPRAVARMEETVRAVTDSVLGELSPGQAVDLVDAVAAPIPVVVIAELLGVGDAVDRHEFRRWSDACIEAADIEGDDAAARMATAGELFAFLHEQVADRRRAPRDDLITTLVQAEVDDRPLRDDEVVMYCLALLVAGNETTRHLISGSLAALAEHPDQRRSLIAAGPAALPGAVEECLRWITPIQTFARTATVDLELGGETIEAGDWVVMLYASANRDERAFGPTADRFDIARPPDTAHTAFGFGEHLCLGASLARLEARVLLERFLLRFPTFTPTDPPTWVQSTLVRGFASLGATL